MFADRFIQIAAAYHAKPFAVVFAQSFGRQIKKKIGYRNFIQVNALAVRNDIFVIIAADRRNNNMVAVKMIRPHHFFQTSIAGNKQFSVQRIDQMNDTRFIIDPALDGNRRIKFHTLDIRKFFCFDAVINILGLAGDTEKLLKILQSITSLIIHQTAKYVNSCR